MTDPKKAIATLRYFVQKATKWNEGADELARAEGVYGALDHIDTLTRERDEARKERDAWELSSTNWQADCRVAQSQLAAARELMAEAAQDIKYMVNAEYHGPDDVHPAMRAKYTRDMEIVSRLTAALTQEAP